MLAYILLVVFPSIIFLLYHFPVTAYGDNALLKRQCWWKNRNAKTLSAFFVIYFFILALRADTIGVDLQQYLPRFQTIAQSSFSELVALSESVNPGYIAINKLISFFSRNNQFFLAVIAACTVIPIAILYKKESEHAMLSISIFLILPLFSMFFSGLRQTLAIAMVVPAFYCAKNKKRLLFLLTVLIAYLFHSAGIFIILLYPVYRAKITKKGLFVVIPAMVFVYIFNVQIFNFVLQFMGEKYQERYSELSDTGAYTMIVLFIMFAVYSFVVVNDKQLDETTLGMRNLLLLSIVLQFFAPINPIAMRVNYFYILFIPLLISRITMRCKQDYIQIVGIARILMCCFFVCYFFYKAFFGTDTLEVFPYLPFWS